jgi:hypothetical protein
MREGGEGRAYKSWASVVRLCFSSSCLATKVLKPSVVGLAKNCLWKVSIIVRSLKKK